MTTTICGDGGAAAAIDWGVGGGVPSASSCGTLTRSLLLADPAGCGGDGDTLSRATAVAGDAAGESAGVAVGAGSGEGTAVGGVGRSLFRCRGGASTPAASDPGEAAGSATSSPGGVAVDAASGRSAGAMLGIDATKIPWDGSGMFSSVAWSRAVCQKPSPQMQLEPWIVCVTARQLQQSRGKTRQRKALLMPQHIAKRTRVEAVVEGTVCDNVTRLWQGAHELPASRRA